MEPRLPLIHGAEGLIACLRKVSRVTEDDCRDIREALRPPPDHRVLSPDTLVRVTYADLQAAEYLCSPQTFAEVAAFREACLLLVVDPGPGWTHLVEVLGRLAQDRLRTRIGDQHQYAAALVVADRALNAALDLGADAPNSAKGFFDAITEPVHRVAEEVAAAYPSAVDLARDRLTGTVPQEDIRCSANVVVEWALFHLTCGPGTTSRREVSLRTQLLISGNQAIAEFFRVCADVERLASHRLAQAGTATDRASTLAQARSIVLRRLGDIRPRPLQDPFKFDRQLAGLVGEVVDRLLRGTQ